MRLRTEAAPGRHRKPSPKDLAAALYPLERSAAKVSREPSVSAKLKGIAAGIAILGASDA
jgi:hypothetical protein